MGDGRHLVEPFVAERDPLIDREGFASKLVPEIVTAPEALRIELIGMTVHGAGENSILLRHSPRERIVRVAHSAFDDVHPNVLMRDSSLSPTYYETCKTAFPRYSDGW
ncbi:MAG: hypothetical protein NVS1B6_05500 [Steroidobacteraceae bacterium]